jgi:hypothetical protein
MPASTGAAAVLENLACQFAVFPDSYEYKTINLAVDGDVVLTERLDMIRAPEGVRAGRRGSDGAVAYCVRIVRRVQRGCGPRGGPIAKNAGKKPE